MPAAAIEWKRETEDGERLHVLAERVGETWTFSVRRKRFDEWTRVEAPPLDDWLELLDGVRRRIGRGLMKRDEEKRVVAALRARFPEAEIPTR